MYIRKKVNKSGTTSVSLIDKSSGLDKVIKSFGASSNPEVIEQLYWQARQHKMLLEEQTSLFPSSEDALIKSFLDALSNAQIQVKGPELIFGKLFDKIGFSKVEEHLFRHLVIARLAYPGSKLKTIDYLYRYFGESLEIDTVYRFLDKLNDKLKPQVEEIAFAHTKRLLGGCIGVVFYDMTTLYFEASDEDDLRKTGFSKDGKHHCPQIFIGLLVGMEGYAIGYDIFEGNIFEGHTLIPILQKFEHRFDINKPIVVADSGLLSKKNIEALEQANYGYIIGARPKNETENIKQQIVERNLSNAEHFIIEKNKHQRLIIAYLDVRASKDKHNRKRGLMRLEKQLRTGKLTKANINNKGYNRYLSIEGEINIRIDYEKFEDDARWDGIKGYVTNTKLKANQIIDSYKHLWQIEKAFRISKTDLKIRPIYHRLRNRIEAHICISFTAYTVYKELERLLKKEKSTISLKRAADLTHNMYQINYILPESKLSQSILLKMNQEQQEILNIVLRNI